MRLLLLFAACVAVVTSSSFPSCSAGELLTKELVPVSAVPLKENACKLLEEPCAPCSDVWGIEVQKKRFAIVGLTNGLQFVDVTDPAAPITNDTWFIPGCLNQWRDMKVLGQL